MSRKWRTLFSCCLISLTAFPGNTYGWVFYVSYLKSSLQLSSAKLGMLWFVAVITSSATLPLWGYILNWWSEREVLSVLSLLFVTCIASIAVIDSVISLTLVLFTLRSLQGGLSVISANAINSWYRLDKKALPSSLVCGCNFLTELFPVLLGYSLINYSIAHIAFMEATSIAIVLALSVACFSNKSRPRFSQLDIQGGGWDEFSVFEDEVEALGSPDTVILPLGSGTDPTKSCLFWLIVAIGVLYQSLWSAISLFSIELFKIKGIGELSYVNTFYVAVALGSITCFVFETCLLRLYGAAVRIWVMATHCFLLAAACALWLSCEGGYVMVVVFALFISFSGAFSVVYTAMFAHIWGAEMEGWMYTVVISLTTISAGLGPIILGRIMDVGERRSLELMFLTCSVANGAVGLSLLCVFYKFWVNLGYERIESPLSPPGSSGWS